MTSSTIFLSTVTEEFRALRVRLANLLQRTAKVRVRHQEGFFKTGVKTLRQLQEEVEQSDLVLHVIGAEPGSPPPVEQVEELVRLLPDLAERFPEVIQRAMNHRVTYTQWEAWLAAYYGKRLCCYRLDDRLPPAKEPPATDSPVFGQWEHADCLGKFKHYPKPVANAEALYDEIIGTLIELKLLTEQEAHRPIKLPYPSLGTLFKGRQQFLEQLRSSLQRAGDGQATAIVGKAVHGLGGVGKTRLAVEYAWQHASEFSAVLFVTAESPESLQRELAELTGPLVLNLPEYAATDETVRVAAAIRWLHEHPGWFLILDNVDTEAAVEYVERFLANLYRGHVLITSRLAKWNESVEPLELDVLDAADAAQFLLQRTQPRGNRGRRIQPTDDVDAAELARELDSLALALEQAGAYIAQLRISLRDYLQQWRQHLPQVQDWHDRTMQYPRSVAVTWQTTLDQLGRLDPRTVDLLNVLAWFAPEPIPLSVIAPALRFLAEGRSTEANPAAAPATTDQDESVLREAIAILADYSMLRWDVPSATVTVHRVVQEILRTRQTAPTESLTVALRLLDEAMPDDSPADVRTWPQWELLRPHVAFAADQADQCDIATPTSSLLGSLGTLLSGKALHAEAEAVKRRALAIDTRHFGPDSTEVAVRLNNLAQTLQATNRLAEAEPLMRRALDIDEAAFGDRHPNVAIRLNNLAGLLHETNRLADAEPLMRRALDIDEAAFGGRHPNVAIRLNNLARLLQDTNRLAEAEPLMRHALDIDEAAFGDRHPNVARDLNNLAQLLQDTNRLADAEPLMRRALDIDEAAFGGSHPRVATELNNLARLLQATNRLAEAEPLMRRALDIDEVAFGDSHPKVAIRLNNLARLLQVTNRLAEAEPLMRRHVTIFAMFGRSTGHEHPLMQAAIWNYRGLLAAMEFTEIEIAAGVQQALDDTIE